MPILCFKKKINIDGYEEIISFAFNCIYDDSYNLKLSDDANCFDCGDFRIKIDEAIKKLNKDILDEYDSKNGNIRYMALLDHFHDNIPKLYSIKIESNDGDSIYYVNELKKR